MAHRETKRHMDAFEVWWANDRSSDAIQKHFMVSGRTAANWIEWFGWHARADGRDAAVKAKQDRDAVARRAKMIEEHRKAAQLMRLRGQEWFGQNKLEHGKDAIAAVKAGIEIERTAEGLPAWVLEILNADESTLMARLAELTAGESDAGEGADPGDPAGAWDPAGDDPGGLPTGE